MTDQTPTPGQTWEHYGDMTVLVLRLNAHWGNDPFCFDVLYLDFRGLMRSLGTVGTVSFCRIEGPNWRRLA